MSWPPPEKLTAHSFRGMATSWALFQGASVRDICNAAVWATPHTFTRFYRLNVVDPQIPGFRNSVKGGFSVDPYNTGIEVCDRGEICADSTGVFTGLQEGAAVIQQPPVSHGRDTGRWESGCVDFPPL